MAISSPFAPFARSIPALAWPSELGESSGEGIESFSFGEKEGSIFIYIKPDSRLSFGEIPSKIQSETSRPRVIRIIRRLSVILDVVLSGFNGRTWEGRREWRCAENKLIRFCLLIYPLVHAPRTNERGRKSADRGRGRRRRCDVSGVGRLAPFRPHNC